MHVNILRGSGTNTKIKYSMPMFLGLQKAVMLIPRQTQQNPFELFWLIHLLGHINSRRASRKMWCSI